MNKLPQNLLPDKIFNMESTYQKIIRKTGFKPTNCKCSLCKSQCNSPCLGTPEDMAKIIGAGFSNRLMITEDRGVSIIAPLYDENKESCTFFTDGLCELHDKGLKPTEGKLSHHTTTLLTFNKKKSVHAAVLKEWVNISEDELTNLFIIHNTK